MTPGTKEAAAKLAYKKGFEYELKYHGWSQCIILALQETFGMKNDDIFKAASGFGGGMGMLGDTCGALVGASMMLGLKYGRGRENIENIEALRESGVPVAKLYKWFQTEFGSATCHDIRTRFGGGAFYDFSIPWQRELSEKAKVFEQCSDLVGKAAARAAEMLWDAIEAEKKGQNSYGATGAASRYSRKKGRRVIHDSEKQRRIFNDT